MRIEEITQGEALAFLRDNRADREQVTASPSAVWLGAFDVAGALMGVVGVNGTALKARIKSLFVRPSARGCGAGTELVARACSAHCAGKAVTAFSTRASRGLFLRLGFREEWENAKTKIAFVAKEAE